MQIYIISLEPNSPEVAELLKALKSQSLTAEIRLGVDGRQGMPELEDGESLDQALSLKMRLVELSSGEIGCYLSHLRTIKHAYQADFSRICILEDDVELEEDFSQILAKLETLPDTVELVRLMGLKTHKRKTLCSLGDRHVLARPVKGLCGTQGYVLNRIGMEKIIRLGSALAEPIDKFYDHFWDIDLRTYSVEPHLIWERAKTVSSIPKNSRKKAAKPLLKRLAKHRIKLTRGLKRRAYLFKHRADFFPATLPPGKMGKTARMK
jgi:glycosyl transferase, family 25